MKDSVPPHVLEVDSFEICPFVEGGGPGPWCKLITHLCARDQCYLFNNGDVLVRWKKDEEDK